MNKRVRKTLGGISAASLIMAGSIPLMGGEPPKTKTDDTKRSQSQAKNKSQQSQTSPNKPAVTDNPGGKSCSCGKRGNIKGRSNAK